MPKYEIKTIVKEEKFEPVAKAFENNFAKRLEKSGSQLCIFQEGKKVLELVGKYKGEIYDEKSTQLIESSGKVVTSFVAAYLVNQGKLRYESPLVEFLPDFIQGNPSKKDILVEDILRHDAGLNHQKNCRQHITFDMVKDEEEFKEFLSKVEPFWTRKDMQKANKTKHILKPKSRSYQATNRGFYMNQVFKSTTNKTVGDILKDEIEPMLGKNVSIGCGKPDPRAVRGARDSLFQSLLKLLMKMFLSSTPFTVRKMMQNSLSILQIYDILFFKMKPLELQKQYFEVECPSFGMLTNAVSLASLANAMLFQENPILSEETQKLMFSDPKKKYDFALNITTVFDKGGFSVFADSDFEKDVSGLGGFRGWGGFGGSVILFHPEKQLVFSYTPSYLPFSSAGGFTDDRCLNVFKEFVKLI
eukprot:maker-scaffold_3-snap-gene-8.47-mRNA-1 protein AED:0.00 eAED:0.00 QI:113/1/1/1/1/1/2/187/415